MKLGLGLNKYKSNQSSEPLLLANDAGSTGDIAAFLYGP